MNIFDTIRGYNEKHENKLKTTFKVFYIYFRFYFLYDLSYYFWRITGGAEKTLNKISTTHEKIRNTIQECRNNKYSLEEIVTTIYGYPPGTCMHLEKNIKLWVKSDIDISNTAIELYLDEQKNLKMIFLNIKKIFKVDTKKIVNIDRVVLSSLRYFFEDIYINKNISNINKNYFKPPIEQIIKESKKIKELLKEKKLKGFIVIKQSEKEHTLNQDPFPKNHIIKSINLYIGKEEDIVAYLEKKSENHGKIINLRPIYITIK